MLPSAELPLFRAPYEAAEVFSDYNQCKQADSANKCQIIARRKIADESDAAKRGHDHRPNATKQCDADIIAKTEARAPRRCRKQLRHQCGQGPVVKRLQGRK